MEVSYPGQEVINPTDKVTICSKKLKKKEHRKVKVYLKTDTMSTSTEMKKNHIRQS